MDYDATTVPADIEAHKRTLWNSKFLAYYDAAERTPTPAQVMEAMTKVAWPQHVEAYRTLVETNKSSLEGGREAVQVWSCAESCEPEPKRPRVLESGQRAPTLFKVVNNALIHDDANLLKGWVTFIRGINSFVTRPENAAPSDLTVYRGSKMSRLQADRFLKKDTVVRPCMFVATSRNKVVAEMYSRQQVIIQIKVPQGCRNALILGSIANHVDEEEVLLPPYSPLLIKSAGLNRDGFYVVETELLDGMVISFIERDAQCKELLPGMPDAVYGRHALSCII